ncbi:hypothetical protein ZIOFF_028861 [Zingiber officinale]|uniref:Uncharacterized protein n=1 Tax=Zingiber officinale TaxID=94328 RepID=A0A8J5LE36_ZINOF|nr:hypothetical protein ZIOFF_028861 [Zingiber officinale]
MRHPRARYRALLRLRHAFDLVGGALISPEMRSMAGKRLCPRRRNLGVRLVPAADYLFSQPCHRLPEGEARGFPSRLILTATSSRSDITTARLILT